MSKLLGEKKKNIIIKFVRNNMIGIKLTDMRGVFVNVIHSIIYTQWSLRRCVTLFLYGKRKKNRNDVE